MLCPYKTGFHVGALQATPHHQNINRNPKNTRNLEPVCFAQPQTGTLPFRMGQNLCA